MDEIKTVLKTINNGLCISCGICVGNCPKNCLKLIEKNKQFLPQIDNSACIKCERCYKVCPVNQLAEYEGKENLINYILGNYIEIVSAKTKDNKILKESASGGFITQTIDYLLSSHRFDCAFLVEGYNYDKQLKTTRFFMGGGTLKGTSKSRYLLVSHENTVKYIINNPNEKVIIVATGCVIHGILNTIKLNKLNRENYLLIGLFCEKTMNQGVVEYFKSHPVSKGKNLSRFYFKTKEAGGWPGNVRLFFDDDTFEDLPNTERMKLKDYFQPERCLYCIDKLNRDCDISAGDNYIPKNKDSLGISSIIIRTKLGYSIWQECCSLFEYHNDSVEDLISSQHLTEKNRNYLNACIKGLYSNNPLKADKTYIRALERIQIGLSEDVYKNVNKDIYKHLSFKRKVKAIIKKLLSIFCKKYRT